MVLKKNNVRISKLTALITILAFIVFTLVVLYAKSRSDIRHHAQSNPDKATPATKQRP
jgi:hypothetical protein